jgi:hypothetical protein
MFGRECRIPIDIIYPNKLELKRDKIVAKRTININSIRNQIELDATSDINTIDILPDITISEIEATFPQEVQKYINELRERLNKSYESLEKNRMLTMRQNKILYDRKIRKKEYNLGDWVLCNHPHIKKGLSRGLAPRYHGAYIIVGKYANKWDYLIRPHNQPKAKVKQIHQNNLKLYFRRGHPVDNIKIDQASDIDIAVPTKRPYHKDLANPRWQRARGSSDRENSYDAEASESEPNLSPQRAASSVESSSSEQVPKTIRRGRPKGSTNKAKNITTNVPPAIVLPIYTTKSGRIIRPQNRFK